MKGKLVLVEEKEIKNFGLWKVFVNTIAMFSETGLTSITSLGAGFHVMIRRYEREE